MEHLRRSGKTNGPLPAHNKAQFGRELEKLVQPTAEIIRWDKSAEREWREEGESVTYTNLTAGQKMKQFRNFLRNGQNKNSLITFFNDY